MTFPIKMRLGAELNTIAQVLTPAQIGVAVTNLGPREVTIDNKGLAPQKTRAFAISQGTFVIDAGKGNEDNWVELQFF